MRKQKKTILLLLMVLALAAVFTGCDEEQPSAAEPEQQMETAVEENSTTGTFKDYQVIYDMFYAMINDTYTCLYDLDESGDLANAVNINAIAMTTTDPYYHIFTLHGKEDTWATPRERDVLDVADEELSVTKTDGVYLYTEKNYYDDGTTATITLQFNPASLSGDYSVVSDNSSVRQCRVQYTVQDGVLYVVESRWMDNKGGLRNIVLCYDGVTHKYASVQTNVQSSPQLPVEIYDVSGLSWDMLYGSYDFADVFYEYNSSTMAGTYKLPNN